MSLCARSEILVVLALLLSAVGACSPSAQQIMDMKRWSSSARASCSVPGQCVVPEACIRAVVAATEPAAGRAEYDTAKQLCWPYGGAQ